MIEPNQPTNDRITRGPRANCGRGQVIPPLYSFWAPGSGGTYSYLTATQESDAGNATRPRAGPPNVEERNSLFLPFLFLLPPSLSPFLSSRIPSSRPRHERCSSCISLFLGLFFSPSLLHCSAISRPEPAKIVSAVLDSACGSFQRCDTHHIDASGDDRPLFLFRPGSVQVALFRPGTGGERPIGDQGATYEKDPGEKSRHWRIRQRL